MTPAGIKKAFFADIDKLALKYLAKIEKLPLKTWKQTVTAEDALSTVSSMIDQFHQLPKAILKRFDLMDEKILDRFNDLAK